jgi:UDP-N-acetyl-D-mannosaminuronate dehydrogenase
VWEPITDARRITVSIESAEIIKMASNTIQFFKIQYINALAALAEKTSADIDEVSEGLAKVLNHGWIPKAGMPDGGACRPRDVAAMTAIADGKYVSDLWMLMRALDNARKTQFDRMALEIQRLADKFPDLPILILGDAYKAGVTYSDGSPGKYLLRSLYPATKRSVSLVPGTFNENSKFLDKAIYVVAVPYPINLRRFPMGSVVYDVWGMTTDDPNLEVTYISPGRFPHV